MWRWLGGTLPICVGWWQGGAEVFGGHLAGVGEDEAAQESGGDGALTAGVVGPDLGAAGLRVAFVAILVSVVQHLPLAVGVEVVDGASGGPPVVVSVRVRFRSIS